MKRKLVIWGIVVAALGMVLGLTAFTGTDNVSREQKSQKSVCSSEHTFHDITFCLPSQSN